jgi:hypothetical protein
LIRRREWKTPLGRLGNKWEASLEICLKKMKWTMWVEFIGFMVETTGRLA